MACGLPVVASEWKELALLQSPAILCNTKEKFTKAVAQSVTSQVDRNLFIDFARQNSWDSSFKRLLQATMSRSYSA